MWVFDQSEVAMARANELFDQNALPGDLRCWDMPSTLYPYGNSFFDAVIAIRVLHHATLAIRWIIDEIKRITKKRMLASEHANLC